ncbi:MAG: DcrB-related protein [Sedimenticola sp.]
MPNIQGSGFVIDVPEECIDASVYTFAFPEKGGYAANLMVRFEAVVGAFDLQKYVEEQLDGLQQKVEEFKLVSQAAGKRGAFDGVMSIYEWGKEPARIRQKQVVLFVPGEQPRKYILTTTDLASQSANSDPLFDQMLRSFEINVA